MTRGSIGSDEGGLETINLEGTWSSWHDGRHMTLNSSFLFSNVAS